MNIFIIKVGKKSWKDYISFLQSTRTFFSKGIAKKVQEASCYQKKWIIVSDDSDFTNGLLADKNLLILTA